MFAQSADTPRTNAPRHKTFKRETALALLAFWAGLVVWGVLGNPSAADAATTIMWPVFGFAAGAFGIDAFAEQIR